MFNVHSTISQFTNLKSLHLACTDAVIPKSVPLAVATALPRLRQLHLESHRALQDLRPLAALTDLEMLELVKAGLTQGFKKLLQLPPISAFPRLRKYVINAPTIPVSKY